MRSRVIAIAIAIFVGFTVPQVAAAFTYDVMIRQADVTFQPSVFFTGDRVRVYATVRNIGDQDVQGNIFFSENGTAIGTPPPFSVKAKSAEEEVWVDWQPATLGDRQITVRVVTAPETRDEDTTNNEMIISVAVRDRPPPPTPPGTTSGGSAAGGASAAPTSTPAAVEPSTAPAPIPAPAAAMKPKTSAASGAATARTAAETSVSASRSAPSKTAAPASPDASVAKPPESASSSSLVPLEPYDAQLRGLLGNPASSWRAIVPIAAGLVALGGIAALVFLLIRRRRGDDKDETHSTASPNVDRRPRRTT